MFDLEKYYKISLDTYSGVHLGFTPKFRIKDDKSYAQAERDKILRCSIDKGLIPAVKEIIFTMYEVKQNKLGEYLEKAE